METKPTKGMEASLFGGEDFLFKAHRDLAQFCHTGEVKGDGLLMHAGPSCLLGRLPSKARREKI